MGVSERAKRRRLGVYYTSVDDNTLQLYTSRMNSIYEREECIIINVADS